MYYFDKGFMTESIVNKPPHTCPIDYGSNYLNHLKAYAKAGTIHECINQFEAYIKAIPLYYDIWDYKLRAQTAISVLSNLDNQDFKKSAINALNYLLFDDFHEDIKYGERHLDHRIDIAQKLFDCSYKPVQEIGAKAILQFVKDDQIYYDQARPLINKILKHGDYQKIGLEAYKIIVDYMKCFDTTFLSLSEPSPRDKEELIKWAQLMGSIANYNGLSEDAQLHAFKDLVSFQELYPYEETILSCRGNKVCIKDCTDSWYYVDNLINSLVQCNPLFANHNE